MKIYYNQLKINIPKLYFLVPVIWNKKKLMRQNKKDYKKLANLNMMMMFKIILQTLNYLNQIKNKKNQKMVDRKKNKKQNKI